MHAGPGVEWNLHPHAMLDVLQCVALIVCTLALVPALAHALERPGKARLAEEQYRAVQRIYFPGFTVVGFFEPVAAVAAAALLVVTPTGTLPFWLVAFATWALVAMHVVYWLVTHPVNKSWLQHEKLGRAGTTFFETGSADGAGGDWVALRDRWEGSHTARAALAGAGFLALAISVATD